MALIWSIDVLTDCKTEQVSWGEMRLHAHLKPFIKKIPKLDLKIIHTHTHAHITHRYLKDFLCVIKHLHPYGHQSPWRLDRRTQARLQGGHPKAVRGAQPLSGRGRPVGWFDHRDALTSCRGLCSRLPGTDRGRKFRVCSLCLFICTAKKSPQSVIGTIFDFFGFLNT